MLFKAVVIVFYLCVLLFYMQNPSEAQPLYCGFALSVPLDDVQVND